MHHENELSEEVKLAMERAHKQAQSETILGATGRFPDGKLTVNDEGELALQIGALKGRVVMEFGKPIASLGLTPEQARDLARLLRLWANRSQRLLYR
jgi:hypothetical protein